MAKPKKQWTLWLNSGLLAVFAVFAVLLAVQLWTHPGNSAVVRWTASISILCAAAWLGMVLLGRGTPRRAKSGVRAEHLFFGMCAAAYLCMVFAIPPGTAPDEPMRYSLTKYITSYNVLPRGDDPALRDPTWGVSYAFLPYLSNLVGVLCQKVYLLFAPQGAGLLYAARIPGVLFNCLTLLLLFKIADRLFEGSVRWLFLALAALLPQYIYLAGYVNCDTLGVLAGAVIIYSWLIGIESNWNTKSLVLLGVGLSVCALSYYFAYGFILCSILLFFATLIRQKTPFKAVAAKSAVVVALCLVLAGWWFARQAVLYSGDFLGMRSWNAGMEQYAIEALKPSVRETLLSPFPGWGEFIRSMLLWIKMSFRSFYGIFGVFAVYVPYFFYHTFTAITVVGLGGALLPQRQDPRTDRWFTGAMAGTVLMAVVLSLYNTLFSGFQPQGRYLMPGMVGLMYLLCVGYRNITLRWKWTAALLPALLCLVTGTALYSVFYYLLIAY